MDALQEGRYFIDYFINKCEVEQQEALNRGELPTAPKFI